MSYNGKLGRRLMFRAAHAMCRHAVALGHKTEEHSYARFMAMHRAWLRYAAGRAE